MTENEETKRPATRPLNREQLLLQVESLIEAQQLDQLRALLAESRSADVAEVAEVLDELARQVLFDLLDPEEAGEVLDKMDDATRSEVVEELTSDELRGIVASMPPDEAADVVGELSDEQSEEILEQIADAESAQIERLLEYDEDTAGGIMNSVVLKVAVNATVADAIECVRRSDQKDDFFCMFVVDQAGQLQGTVDLWSLLRCDPETIIRDMMEANPLAVQDGADQEEIANIFRKNDLLAMGVVDERGVLLGRITVDDVIEVMEEEAEEDALVMAGTHPTELDTRGHFRAASVRLPWLLTCMIGAMVSGAVLVSVFEHRFSSAEWLKIIMFLPAVAAIGGNCGMQTSTIVVRGLATGHLANQKLRHVYARESMVAIIVACACGLIAACVAIVSVYVRPGEFAVANAPALGLSVGLAVLFGIMLSTSLGMALPFFFRRVGIDPAISSGPLVTSANDALGCGLYYLLALSLLHAFSG